MDNTNAVAIQAIKTVIQSYQSKIDHLKETLLMLGDGSNPEISVAIPTIKDGSNNKPYPLGKKLRDKVIFIIERENRFMLIREINQYLTDLEPALKEQSTQIRNAITNMKSDKMLDSYKTGKSNTSYVWGKIEWFNEDGKPKAVHHYDTTQPEVD